MIQCVDGLAKQSPMSHRRQKATFHKYFSFYNVRRKPRKSISCSAKTEAGLTPCVLLDIEISQENMCIYLIILFDPILVDRYVFW